MHQSIPVVAIPPRGQLPRHPWGIGYFFKTIRRGGRQMSGGESKMEGKYFGPGLLRKITLLKLP